ncbi:hypothetical protein [Novosphingobium rosa]|uniref:hypothetical protein n=1 Tax=Novosphingobium rosa TaxID=76978 RepID=UPI00082CA44A|nr:hypothetical protein [Novosphingobium rosa]
MADPKKLATSFKGEVQTLRQIGPHELVWVGTPCLIGLTVDVDELVKRIGEKALKSKGKRATAFHGALVMQVKEIEA